MRLSSHEGSIDRNEMREVADDARSEQNGEGQQRAPVVGAVALREADQRLQNVLGLLGKLLADQLPQMPVFVVGCGQLVSL